MKYINCEIREQELLYTMDVPLISNTTGVYYLKLPTASIPNWWTGTLTAIFRNNNITATASLNLDTINNISCYTCKIPNNVIINGKLYISIESISGSGDNRVRIITKKLENPIPIYLSGD